MSILRIKPKKLYFFHKIFKTKDLAIKGKSVLRVVEGSLVYSVQKHTYKYINVCIYLFSTNNRI